MSVPQSNSTHTTEMPIPDAERTLRTPVAPFTEDSMGNETNASTSCGARPCASVMTVTVGAVRSGKTSTGMRTAVTAPYRETAKAAIATNRRFLVDQWLTEAIMRG